METSFTLLFTDCYVHSLISISYHVWKFNILCVLKLKVIISVLCSSPLYKATMDVHELTVT